MTATLTKSGAHWATAYIGKPWVPGATGPGAYDCWGLVRAVLDQQLGISMPLLGTAYPAERDNVAAIKTASRTAGWRQITGVAEDFDILLMRNLEGSRHVGVAITANGVRGLLHASGKAFGAVTLGAVCFSPFDTLSSLGFKHLELWRRDARAA